MSFRGFQLSQVETSFIQDLESRSGKELTLVQDTGGYGALNQVQIGATIKNTYISSLHITNCNLNSIPDSIGNLKALEVLSLGGLGLGTLPESIGNITSLQRLYAGKCGLIALPDSIGNLTSLTTYMHLKMV